MMFRHYLYFSSYSETFLEHARQMAAELTERFGLGPASRVLEIGSNDGYLLKYFRDRQMRILGVDPAENIARQAEQKRIPTLCTFFGTTAVNEVVGRLGRADLVVGNNVLAHVPAINDFLSAVKMCLAQGGVAAFEFPYLRDLIDHGEFDTIYHEHVFYCSLTAVRALAARAGLELFGVERQPIHGGSLRIFLQRPGRRAVSEAVTRMLADERTAGLLEQAHHSQFALRVQTLKRELLALIDGLKSQGARLAAYGAAAKGVTLLNYCGIGPSRIGFTVDRNPHKQGLYLPGSLLPIAPPERLLAEMPDYTLILPWNIADEIISQQQEYRGRGGKFIVPIPHPKVVGG
jgi:SAM-dependent methyltransferase